jgi:hypothetical protein
MARLLKKLPAEYRIHAGRSMLTCKYTSFHKFSETPLVTLSFPALYCSLAVNSISTPVTAMDRLIDRFGRPAFSFEYLAATRTSALACISRLERLGRYEYNWSPGESHRLQAPAWLDAGGMAEVLAGLDGGSGDVYARLA